MTKYIKRIEALEECLIGKYGADDRVIRLIVYEDVPCEGYEKKLAAAKAEAEPGGMIQVSCSYSCADAQCPLYRETSLFPEDREVMQEVLAMHPDLYSMPEEDQRRILKDAAREIARRSGINRGDVPSEEPPPYRDPLVPDEEATVEDDKEEVKKKPSVPKWSIPKPEARIQRPALEGARVEDFEPFENM